MISSSECVIYTYIYIKRFNEVNLIASRIYKWWGWAFRFILIISRNKYEMNYTWGENIFGR